MELPLFVACWSVSFMLLLFFCLINKALATVGRQFNSYFGTLLFFKIDGPHYFYDVTDQEDEAGFYLRISLYHARMKVFSLLQSLCPVA